MLSLRFVNARRAAIFVITHILSKNRKRVDESKFLLIGANYKEVN
jgi:hypothetical protein